MLFWTFTTHAYNVHKWNFRWFHGEQVLLIGIFGNSHIWWCSFQVTKWQFSQTIHMIYTSKLKKINRIFRIRNCNRPLTIVSDTIRHHPCVLLIVRIVLLSNVCFFFCLSPKWFYLCAVFRTSDTLCHCVTMVLVFRLPFVSLLIESHSSEYACYGEIHCQLGSI